jgi:uncharacterized SAM-binding protein YcdF (DUF218 family)
VLAHFRGVRKWLLVVGALLVIVTALVLYLFVVPPSDSPGPADVVIVLAGAPETRLPMGEKLAREGSGVLVVSAPDGEINAPARALCRDGDGGIRIICLKPDPPDTRGEARAIGALATRRGWKHITVVTSSYHVSRAGLLVRRCTAADVRMVEVKPLISLGTWVDVVVHEAGGLVAATFDRSC